MSRTDDPARTRKPRARELGLPLRQCALQVAIADENLLERATRVGAVLHQGLHALSAKHALIGDVRGRALAIGLELVKDRSSREPVENGLVSDADVAPFMMW